MAQLSVLMLASPVGPIGSGEGGGEELLLRLTAAELNRRGHRVTVVAPRGSRVDSIAVVEVDGNPQPGAQLDGRAAPVFMPADSVLGRMWSCARELAGDHDLLLNFAYDWLPFYLTPFVSRPVAHWVLMASLSDAMDRMVGEVAERFPGTVAVCTRAQASTFPCAQRLVVVGAGIDVAEYPFCEQPDDYLAWVGRVSPEKGLEDAAAAARSVGLPLKVMGLVQDADYLEQVQRAYPGVIDLAGFLPTRELAQTLGRARALLFTPRWVEALGMVVLEALACGVPVVTYNRGGPAEIVRDGVTGWLVTPDTPQSIDELAAAVGRVGAVDRRACRACAEREHDFPVLGDRVERWLLEAAGRR